MFEYIVQPGDNLYRIADYFDVSMQAILSANPGLNPNFLYVGQRIRIPISRNLYQSYPWYYLFPYMFIRYPRRYWNDRRRWPQRRHVQDRDRWDDRGRSDDRGRWDDRGRSDNRGRGDDRGRSGGVWPVMASIDHWDDWNDWDNMDHNQDPLMGRQYMDQEMDELPQLDLNPQEDTDWPMIP